MMLIISSLYHAYYIAIVAPILKKGDPTGKKNYRPISCLVIASKVMEKVVCVDNNLTNHLCFLNDKINLEWLNLPFPLLKIKCKTLFLTC